MVVISAFYYLVKLTSEEMDLLTTFRYRRTPHGLIRTFGAGCLLLQPHPPLASHRLTSHSTVSIVKGSTIVAFLMVIDRSGVERAIKGETGLSVMEILRDRGFEELQAQCGGACSCATCHVYIDSNYLDRLPSVTEDESDLLDGSDHRTECSRLSCQLIFEDQLDGMQVTIAPEG
jgi:ferredoxin, 2Fe-2S